MGSAVAAAGRKRIDRFFAAQPALRLEFLRALIPLAILGFLSSRLMHPGEWLTQHGFQVPDLGHRDWRQPWYFPPPPLWGAIAICAVTAAAGLCVSAGFMTRLATGIFALCLLYLAMADRLAAFTVSKLGAVLAVALFLTPSGCAYGVDARRRFRKRGPGAEEPRVTWGNIRFFQALLVTLYMASGISKIHGDWLSNSHVLWTHLFDTYQTRASYWIARSLPYSAWPVLQYVVLAFETGAPLWFLLPFTRKSALWVGLGMHVFIGLAFGPVIWFALLMLVLLYGCFGNLDGLVKRLHPRGSGV